jgi:hypothetical protein
MGVFVPDASTKFNRSLNSHISRALLRSNVHNSDMVSSSLMTGDNIA